jgi:hypothetical protein
MERRGKGGGPTEGRPDGGCTVLLPATIEMETPDGKGFRRIRLLALEALDANGVGAVAPNERLDANSMLAVASGVCPYNGSSHDFSPPSNPPNVRDRTSGASHRDDSTRPKRTLVSRSGELGILGLSL